MRSAPSVFGVFPLATGTSRCVNLLDFDLSAATLHIAAQDMTRVDHRGAGETLTRSLAFYSLVGTRAAALLWLLSPWLVAAFSVDAAMRSLAIEVFYLAPDRTWRSAYQATREYVGRDCRGIAKTGRRADSPLLA